MVEKSYLRQHGIRIAVVSVILIILLSTVFFSGAILKSKLPVKYEAEVEKYSEMYGVDKYLIFAVISVESDFDKNTESHVGALGLMQIMPYTEEWINKKFGFEKGDLKDPDVNLNIGCCYISDLIERFGTVELALAAYNGGEGNVREWQRKYSSNGRDIDVIPFKETAKYVKKVTVRYELYKQLYS